MANILRLQLETPSSDLRVTLLILSSIIISGNINSVQTKPDCHSHDEDIRFDL